MSFIKYKLCKDPISSDINVVNKIYTNRVLSIPFNEENTDYQEYLKWCNGEDPYTEKGTPEAPD